MAAFALIPGCGGAAAQTFNDTYTFCSQANCSDGNYAASPLIADASGDFFGTTALGGDGGWGVIFELVPDGNGGYTYSRLHSFCGQANCTDGSDPVAGLILDTSGNLYGTTKFGGSQNGGTAFELVRSGGKTNFRVLHSFCAQGASCADGSNPVYDGLTYRGAANGAPYDGASALYGTTIYGGENNGGFSGVVFELKPVTGRRRWREHVLYDFCTQTNCADGSQPYNGLLADNRGHLFGVTFGGGGNSDGTIFELSKKSGHWTETVLYSFCTTANCPDGRNPESPLTTDSSGNLFGTATAGGGQDGGVLFKLVPKGTNSKYSALYGFCSQTNCTDGQNPMGRVAVDGSGNIFGTTVAGGDPGVNRGVAFELGGGSLQVLHTFCQGGDCNDGAFPVGGVILDPSGNVFGTTSEGGSHSDGVVFEIGAAR
ncbi:MAG TPA: choice-of-anchor tandem repeat GloVer-containing protein [Rhizomicrobium sp.]